MPNSNRSNMWKVIQGLNSTLDVNSSNKAMSHNGSTITNTKTKANIFLNHCARFSKLNMSKLDRDLNRHFGKRYWGTVSWWLKLCSLQLGEWLSSIKKVNWKGEVIPDVTPSTFPRSKLRRSDHLYSPSNRSWYVTTSNATLCTHIVGIPQKIWCGLERKASVYYVKCWQLVYFYPVVTISS